jgi:hypothetical protein
MGCQNTIRLEPALRVAHGTHNLTISDNVAPTTAHLLHEDGGGDRQCIRAKSWRTTRLRLV